MSENDYNQNRRHKENPEQLDRFLEEAAAEVVPLQPERKSEHHKPLAEDQPENRQIDAKSSVGIFALVLSILSLLFMPIILGAAGIIAGIYARNRDAKTMGNWAIALGAISIVVSLFLSPFI